MAGPFKMKGMTFGNSSPLKDPGHKGKRGHTHFFKGKTREIVDDVKKGITTVARDPVGSYIKGGKKIIKSVKNLF